MIRLTKAGKVVAGVLVVLLALLGYTMFFGGSSAPPELDHAGRPVNVPITQVPSPFQFPLPDRQLSEWRARAAANAKVLRDTLGQPLGYCSLLAAPSDLRGRPISFLAVRGNQQTQDYAEFAKLGTASGTNYYPVYPISEQVGGADLAIQAATEGISDKQNASQGCDPRATTLDNRNVVRPIMVAFPPRQTPSSRVIRVDGFLAGNAPNSNGVFTPKVIAGKISDASVLEAVDPPVVGGDIPLNIQLRHQGSDRLGVKLYIQRIQYTPNQTRIKIVLLNQTSKPVDTGWNGADNIRLSADGSVGKQICQAGACPGQSDDVSTKAGQLVDSESASDMGLFDPAQAIPPRPGRSSGWLVFPNMPLDSPLTLTMPDLPLHDADNNGSSNLPFIIKINPNTPGSG